jgi:magnesium transporter
MIGELLRPDLEELIRNQRWGELRDALAELDPSDIAEILVDVPDEDDVVIFRLLPRKQAGQVFAYLPFEQQERLIFICTSEQMRSLIAAMSPDDRTRLLEELPAEVTRRLLEALPPDQLKNARDLLGYPPETAGRYMTPDYVALRPSMTARQALDHIRQTGHGKETLNIVYVVDDTGRLEREIRLGTLVLTDPDARVADIEDRSLVSVPATMDREAVVRAFEKYDRVALPVTDDQSNMLGIITADDVLDVAEREATEDIQKLGGMEALDSPYLDVGFYAMLKKRGGWLSALFIGEMLTATAMGYFEGEIEKAVVLALFVPLIISSGGNSGSQAATIIVRSLALSEVKLRDWWRVMGRELRTSVTLGAWLGFLGFLRVVLWEHLHWIDYGPHYVLIGVVVWISLVGVVTFGSLAGSMLPFLLRRLGFDPATSSAPFVATLVDVTGLVIYFCVALVILRGTLL